MNDWCWEQGARLWMVWPGVTGISPGIWAWGSGWRANFLKNNYLGPSASPAIFLKGQERQMRLGCLMDAVFHSVFMWLLTLRVLFGVLSAPKALSLKLSLPPRTISYCSVCQPLCQCLHSGSHIPPWMFYCLFFFFL